LIAATVFCRPPKIENLLQRTMSCNTIERKRGVEQTILAGRGDGVDAGFLFLFRNSGGISDILRSINQACLPIDLQL
jgi:hypothetical protein